MLKNLITSICLCALLLSLSACQSKEERVSLFSLDHYSQTLSDWINPKDSDYDKPVITESTQKKYVELFYRHAFGDLSPWSESYVNSILQLEAPDTIKSVEQSLLFLFSQQDKSAKEIGYGENFRPHPTSWIQAIADNLDIQQFNHLQYDAKQRAIAIDNANARALPTDDVHFYDSHLPGQGYPFDNLQLSAIWAGTPLYIVGESKDHAWNLVITPDFITWIKSTSLARVTPDFVAAWTTAAKKQLAAIARTQTPVIDTHGQFRFLAYIGSFFPRVNETKIWIPVRDTKQHAAIAEATLSAHDIVSIPITPTPHHFADLMQTLLGRPYGWGNLYFFNDCSAELKSLFTPFGIWLPRHSSNQMTVGQMIDRTAFTPKERISYLMQHGQRFSTIVYNEGHVFLYIGNYPNPNAKDHAPMAMTYQSMWGLRLHPDTGRAVVGQVVFFPLLLEFPEDKNLASQAAKKYFQITFLDRTPDPLMIIKIKDLRSIMFP